MVSSDAGALLLGETDKAIRLVDRFAACFETGAIRYSGTLGDVKIGFATIAIADAWRQGGELQRLATTLPQ